MKVFLSYLLWPLLLGSCLWSTHLGITAGQGFLVFNLIYLSLAVTLFFLERVMPHEPTWLENCGQIGADLAHTLFTKGLVQGVVAVGTTIGLAEVLAPQGGGNEIRGFQQDAGLEQTGNVGSGVLNDLRAADPSIRRN